MNKELLKKYLSNQPKRIRFMYYIGIIQVKEINNTCFKRINPYNPLGYLLVALLMIMGAINEMVKAFPDMKELFDYN